MKEYKAQAAQLRQTGAGLGDDVAGTQIPAEEDGKCKSCQHMFSFTKLDVLFAVQLLRHVSHTIFLQMGHVQILLMMQLIYGVTEPSFCHLHIY